MAGTPTDLGHGLMITPPAGAAVAAFAPADESQDCLLAGATITATDAEYRLLLVRATCPQAGQRALNGNHGQYLVPPEYALDTSAPVTVPTGSLVTFRQVYTECTNSCDDFTDSVGLITLSAPADPEAPVLMILVPRRHDERMADVVTLARALTSH
jgi:hypothetical protein